VEIYGGLIKKSATPTALKRAYHRVINSIIRMNKW